MNGQVFQLTRFQTQSSLMKSKTANDIYYWYFTIIRTAFLFFVYLARLAGFWVHLKSDNIIEIEGFENKIRPAFFKFADCENVEEYKKKNQNIDPIFYTRKELAELMKEENDIEKKWKSRVLIQYTPRGNILMYYDAYKGGFSYYSDHSVVPIRLLNAVAMKYVMNYYCLDFFVDEMAFKENTSPLIQLMNAEDNEENEKTKKLFSKLAKNTNIDEDKLPFLKSKTALSVTTTAKTPEKHEKRINKFIHLGKFNNYSIIQKKKKNVVLVADTEYVFKNVNYDEYKKSKNKPKEE
jgi:hypothetical protein